MPTIRPLAANETDSVLILYRDGLDRELELLNRMVPGKSVNPAGFGELKNMLVHMIETNECRIFGAFDGNTLIGYCLATKKSYPVEIPKICGCINGIFVKPEARRSGLGRQLFETATTWFRSENIHYVDLYYSHNDADAAAFWQKLGFTPVQINCVKVLA